MDQIRLNLGRKAGFRIDPEEFSKIRIDLPATIDQSFGEALRTQLVEQVTESWEYWFGLLERYVEENGNARVLIGHICPDGYKLGNWVASQRSRQDKLDPDRKARLESLPGWTWDRFEDKWEEGFQHLLDYVASKGHAKIQGRYVCPDGYKLNIWVSYQRAGRDQIDSVRKARLESLSGWSWDLIEDQWEEGFQHLLDYVAANGHSRVPRGYRCSDGFKLDMWVVSKRSRREKLGADRKARLESIPGWTWDPRTDDWEKGFRHLLEFVNANGHPMVRRGHVCRDGFNLYTWLSIQRPRQIELDPERKTKLESLPGWTWDPIGDQWEEGFRHLEDFVAANGHARVPQAYACADSYKLGTWLTHQRKQREKLEFNRRVKLESLPGWTWNPLEDQWQEGFRHLADFVSANGHAKVSSGYVCPDGFKLGRWVIKKRAKQKELDPDRKARLESLPGWVWQTKKSAKSAEQRRNSG
ncbi:MAG: short chain dehydrogenase [Betaproteobacteria bacterium ADurb.Bin341]|nr:MAG: short chain dehydrogenase [Betaproteobacteria bacterium ADurb.Bin341]